MLAVVLGLVLIVAAVVYWIEPARSLPSFFPAMRPVEPPPREARHRRVPRRSSRCFVSPGSTPGRKPPQQRPTPADSPSLISYGQAIVLGLLQGVSELFPVSSLGHSVILPSLLGWNIHQNDPYFLTFLVATHLATALVLLGFFWRDWVRIVQGAGPLAARPRDRPDDADAKLGWLLVVGTIPAGLLGLCSSTRCATSSPRRSPRRSS